MLTVLDLNQTCAKKELLQKCARLYCEIWREPPWNENFWKPSDVAEDIVREINRPSGKCFLATDKTFQDNEVIGFTWGYMVDNEYFQQALKSFPSEKFYQSLGKTFYIDELGVDSRFRKSGIGEILSRKLITHAKEAGANTVILRTDEKAMPARKLYAKIGFEESPVRDKKYPGRTYWVLRF